VSFLHQHKSLPRWGKGRGVGDRVTGVSCRKESSLLPRGGTGPLQHITRKGRDQEITSSLLVPCLGYEEEF